MRGGHRHRRILRVDPSATIATFGESDYRYGVGRLTLRIEYVDRRRPIAIDGELWCLVRGVQIGYDGAERGPREVLVRLARLPTR
jgi:hypothetical protein